jgi:hypothetical protein
MYKCGKPSYLSKVLHRLLDHLRTFLPVHLENGRLNLREVDLVGQLEVDPLDHVLFVFVGVGPQLLHVVRRKLERAGTWGYKKLKSSGIKSRRVLELEKKILRFRDATRAAHDILLCV